MINAKTRGKIIAIIAPGLRPFEFFEIYLLEGLFIIILLYPLSKLTSKISSSLINIKNIKFLILEVIIY